MRERGYKRRIHRKGSSRRALNKQEQATNHRRSKVRARVEHVFGDQRTRQGSVMVRTKGKLRAAVKIGLMNLTLQHATAGIRAQAAIRLLHRLSGRQVTERGAERRIGREN